MTVLLPFIHETYLKEVGAQKEVNDTICDPYSSAYAFILTADTAIPRARLLPSAMRPIISTLRDNINKHVWKQTCLVGLSHS